MLTKARKHALLNGTANYASRGRQSRQVQKLRQEQHQRLRNYVVWAAHLTQGEEHMTRKPMSDGGKGSVRRNEDNDAYRNNYDAIFGKKTMMNEHDEHEDFEEDYDETDAEECPVCRGQLVLTGTKMYLFCDTCGHREEVDHDCD